MMNQGVKNYINALQRNSKMRHRGVDFTKMEKFMKKPQARELPVTPDPPKPAIQRPPAKYDNSQTPYGIASELHGKKEEEDSQDL